jgi:hypothetical protein
MERRLIPRHQWFGALATRSEVGPERFDLVEGIHLRLQLYNRQGMVCEPLQPYCVPIGYKMARSAMFMEPASQREAASLRSAHLDDLGQDDGVRS